MSRPVSRVDEILQASATACGVRVPDLLSGPKSKTIARARHVAAYALRVGLHQSYAEIGRVLGHRDHTSAWHAVRKVGADTELRALATCVAGLPKLLGVSAPPPSRTSEPFVLDDGTRVA